MNINKVNGALIGCAIGDALGLPFEGLSSKKINNLNIENYALFGKKGFVSDDTQLTFLLTNSLLRGDGDIHASVKYFRRTLVQWFFTFPWGIGMATLKACFLIAIGINKSGRNSAGNGAAMRASPVGLIFHDNQETRLRFGKVLAEVTHTDQRGVEGATFVAEMTALCLSSDSESSRVEIVRKANEIINNKELSDAILEASNGLKGIKGSSGYVVHSVSTAVGCFVENGDNPMLALKNCIKCGGDTDSNAAILGAWLGALNGVERLPKELVDNLQEGAFGREHLSALSHSIVSKTAPPPLMMHKALVLNILLFPVVLWHGVRRMFPVW